MFDNLFIVLAAVSGIAILALSKSKKNYQNLVENNGEEFANKSIKILKWGGYALLILAGLLFCLVIAGF